MTTNLLHNLCRANQALLQHKIDLMSVLIRTHGQEQAHTIFHRPCPIVQATIGQHYRHSLDHVEKAVTANGVIRYDVRQRDTPEENDWTLMEMRIRTVEQHLKKMMDIAQSRNEAYLEPVESCFMLSGESEEEFHIPSLLGRELAFTAHHTIHHLALVKIIATGSVGRLQSTDLPIGFGRAPSTINFERKMDHHE